MKKTLLVLPVLVLAVCLTACGKSDGNSDSGQAPVTAAAEEQAGADGSAETGAAADGESISGQSGEADRSGEAAGDIENTQQAAGGNTGTAETQGSPAGTAAATGNAGTSGAAAGANAGESTENEESRLSGPCFILTAESASRGQEFRATLSMEDNPGIIAARLALHYDEGLTLVSVSDSGLLKDSMFGSSTADNPYYLCWDGALLDADITESGTLAVLTFRVNENAQSGSCKIWLTWSPDEVFDYNLDNVLFGAQSAVVTIAD